MKKTGELLKQKRESSNLSVGEVALATKINPKILTAIENGDEANLPAKTFLKGFVRSYALFLKMNVDEVMRQFTEDTGGAPAPTVHEAYRPAEPPANGAAPAPRRSRPPGEGSAGMRTAAVVVIILLIGLIIGIRELIEKYQKEKIVATGEVKVSPLVTPPVVPQPQPPTVTPANGETGTTDAVPADDGKAADSAAVKPEATAKTEAATTAKPEVAATVGTPVALTAPKTEPKPEAKIEAKVESKPDIKPKTEPKSEAKAAAKPETKPVVAKTETPATSPSPVAKPTEVAKTDAAASATTPPPDSALKSLKNEIILEALDKVDVEFKMHGETKKFSLGPTQVHTIRTDGPVVLDLSDGGAVNIILNGQERGTPGELGKPKQVKLP